MLPQHTMTDKPWPRVNRRSAGLMDVQGAASEIRKRGVPRYDLRDPYHIAVTLPWPGFIGAALACLAAVNLFFAALYAAKPGAIANLPPGDVLRAFFSLETLATVGYGEMAPDTIYGHVVASVEIVIGIAFTAILTGLLFIRFSKARAKIIFANQAVVATHNGAPTLMVRLANGRFTELFSASAQIGVLLHEVTDEGYSLSQVHELRLTRSTIPIFPLTWTLMHTIDDASPLKAVDLSALGGEDARLFVTVQAFDGALGAQVQAAKHYDRAHVVVGMRYGEATTRDAAGGFTADLSRISSLEPERA